MAKAKSKSSNTRSSRRLQQKAVAGSNSTVDVVVQKEQTVVPPAVVAPPEAVDVSSPDNTSGIKVTISTLGETNLSSVGKKRGINIFHEHFAGIEQYPFMMLRVFAKEELRQVREVWDDKMREEMYDKLFEAIPDMSSVYGNAKWPEPVGFSPMQVANAYALFLEFFLEHHGTLESVEEDREEKKGDSCEGVVVEYPRPKASDAPDLEVKKPNIEVADAVPSVGPDAPMEEEFWSGEDAPPKKKNKNKGGARGDPKKNKKKRGSKRNKKKKSSKHEENDDNSQDVDDDESDSSMPSLESQSSSSSSDSDSSSDSEDTSEDERARREREKEERKRRRRKRKRNKEKRKRKEKRRRRSKKKKKRPAFAERVQAVEYSQSVGKEKYSKEHLYSCKEVLKAYRLWSDPKSRGDQRATVPKEVRQFIDRYLADEDAKILEAYDLPHVKKSQGERKHVTFLMNKMGKLAAGVANARLERARLALDKHNRMIAITKLSKKEREESIQSECSWAGQIRWLSELVSKGEASYYKAKEKLAESRRVDNFRCAHPDVSEAEAIRIVRKMDESVVEQPSASTAGATPAKSKGSQKQINDLKSQLGILMKRQAGGRTAEGTGDSRKKNVKFEFECWHCKSKKHPVAKCPVAKAGKPPVKGSYFWKRQNENKGGGANTRE